MTLPNFLIIGAAKSGTTSLYYYLKQHPEIFLPEVKEPRFFALEGETLNFQNPDQFINTTSITDYDDYLHLFENVTTETAIGEVSPLYLYSKKAVARIKHYIPETKLIAILRNPSDRAFSCYTHLLREGYETLTFMESLALEKSRMSSNWAHLWHYINGGYYYRQLKPYFDTFPRQQLKIFLYEDLVADPMGVCHDIFRYLEVGDRFEPNLAQQNVSGVPKSRFVHNILSRQNTMRTVSKQVLPRSVRQHLSQALRAMNMNPKPSLPSEHRAHLIEIFREDILQLQDLLGLDLSMWLASSKQHSA